MYVPRKQVKSIQNAIDPLFRKTPTFKVPRSTN